MSLEMQPPSPVRGGTLRVLMTDDVDSLDPHRAARPSSWFFARALHRGLLAFPNEPFPAGARPVPDLASGMPVVSPSGRTYTFTLRQAAFSDGTQVTAADVRASLQRVLRVDRGVARFLWAIQGAAAYAQRRASSVSGIATPDPRTVRIVLSQASPDLPWILAHPQVAVVPAGTALRATSVVGAGPYTVRAHQPERSISLVRNQRWRSDSVRRANVDRIEASIGDPAGEALRSVVAGRTHLIAEPGPPDVAPPPPAGARVVRAPSSCVRYVFANGLSARLVRDIARALDRTKLPSSIDGSVSLIPPVMFSAAEPIQPPPARGLAGRATLVAGDSPRDRAEAGALRTMLARAGITLSLRFEPPALLYERSYLPPARGVSLGLATWCADWPGLSGRAVFDALLGVTVTPPTPGCRRTDVRRARARAAAQPPEQQATAWEAVDRLMAGCGVIALGRAVEPAVIATGVGGWTGAPMFPRGDPTGVWVAR